MKTTVLIGCDETGLFTIRKLLTLLLLAFMLTGAAQSTVTLKDGVYTSVTKARTSAPAKDTGKVYQDSKGNRYPIMQSESGAYFVIRTSQKTGKTYKQYLKL